MLGPRAALVLTGSALRARREATLAAGGARRAAIKDGAAALDSSAGCRGTRRGGWCWSLRRSHRSFIHRPRAGLRHDDTTRRRRSGRCFRLEGRSCFRFERSRLRSLRRGNRQWGGNCDLRGDRRCGRLDYSGPGGLGYRGRRWRSNGFRRGGGGCLRGRRFSWRRRRRRYRDRLFDRGCNGLCRTRRCRSHHRRPDDHGNGWCGGDRWPSGRRRGGSLGHNRIRRGPRRDCRGGRRRDNAGFGARLRYDPPGLGPGRCLRGRWRGHHAGRGWLRRCLRLCLRSGTRGRLTAACRCFLFLFLGENGLQRIAGLGDVGQVDLRLYPLWRALRAPGASRRTASPLEMRAHLLGLVFLNRTGVGFALTQAELSQNVKNLLALDFHLAREIVDSNLAHPPLFECCYPKP